MGFLENLRRKIREEEIAEKQREQIVLEEKKRLLEIQQERERIERGRITVERKKSHEFLERSNFPIFILELKDLEKSMEIKRTSSDRHDYEFESEVRGAAQIDLEWDPHIAAIGRDYMVQESKTVSIIFFPDGTVKVRGKRTQILPFNRWNNNPNFQEEALGKAYRNPGRKEQTSYSPYQGAGS